MDKIKKEVVKTAKDKGKLLKIIAKIISWLTKGKIEKNTVLAIGGVVLALSNNFSINNVDPAEVAFNLFKAQIEVQSDLPALTDTITVDTNINK